MGVQGYLPTASRILQPVLKTTSERDVDWQREMCSIRLRPLLRLLCIFTLNASLFRGVQNDCLSSVSPVVGFSSEDHGEAGLFVLLVVVD